VSFYYLDVAIGERIVYPQPNFYPIAVKPLKIVIIAFLKCNFLISSPVLPIWRLDNGHNWKRLENHML